MCRLHKNTTAFYIRIWASTDLGIKRWSCPQFPTNAEGWLWWESFPSIPSLTLPYHPKQQPILSAFACLLYILYIYSSQYTCRSPSHTRSTIDSQDLLLGFSIWQSIFTINSQRFLFFLELQNIPKCECTVGPLCPQVLYIEIQPTMGQQCSEKNYASPEHIQTSLSFFLKQYVW